MPSAAIDQHGATLAERLRVGLDAADVFRALASRPHVVYFDSASRCSPLGRYSFVAADPIAWWEAPNAGADAANLWARIASLQLPGELWPDLPPFQGGIAGLFGYELGGSFEKVPHARIADIQVPALAVGWYDVVAAFDHQQQTAWLISQGWPETDPQARRARAAERLAQFRAWIEHPPPQIDASHDRESPPLSTDQLAPQHATAIHGLTSNFSAAGYRRAVQRAIDYIHAGDVFQVNLAQRLLHAAEGSPVELYGRLRQRNPAPFAGYLDLGGCQLCSASPERFLHVANGQVQTRPIKGTAPRERDPQLDRASASRLLASAKDRAENVMIVDLLRNDLSRTCRAESVQVSQLCALESFATVHHLVSVVEGTLREGHTPWDVLRASFPGGSITGAPKIRAMEIIAELETTPRGAYCGSLGYVGVGSRMDTNILIRTITASRGWWQLPVGSGIVAQSDPQAELDETWSKARGMLQALCP